jgi:hypothetical protein
MRIVVFLLIMFCVVPAVAFGYGYQHFACTCDPSLAGVDSRIDLTLNNIGGQNIFYFSGNEGTDVYYLYANVTKDIQLSVLPASDGSVGVDVSTNYNNNFTVTCGSCTQKATDYGIPLSFAAGLFCAAAFAGAAYFML